MTELKAVFERFGYMYAVDSIKEKRKSKFYEQYVVPFTHEARRLSLTLSEMIELIEGGYEEQ